MFCTELGAQTPNCNVNSPATDETGANQYKINYTHIDELTPSGVSSVEWKYNVLNAAEQWNANANGGWFEYDGDTTVDWIPQSNCTSAQDINLVTIGVYDEDNPSACNGTGYNAVHQTRCDGKRFMITICASTGAGDMAWSVGDTPSAFVSDVNAVLAHEFGHAIGLNHATGDEFAVVHSTTTGSLKQRNLYPWDIECHEREYGRRSQPIKYRLQPHDSSFGISLYQMANGYAKGVGHARFSSGSAFMASTAYDYRFRSSTGTTLGTPTDVPISYSGSLTSAWIREVPSMWRILFTYDLESLNRFENTESLTNIFQLSYPHNFSGTATGGVMEHCTVDPSGCSPEPLRAYYPPSMSYDHAYSERSVFAWVNQTREDQSDDREIWISVGNRGISGTTLNEPFKTGIRSSINVSVACGPKYAADGYECIMVYSPIESASFPLRVRRFYVQSFGTDIYSLVFDNTTTNVGWLTGSNATAWYNDDAWWIAHTSGTGIQVRTSTDSSSWSHSSTLQAPVSAPQAITVGEPTNRTTRLYFTGR